MATFPAQHLLPEDIIQHHDNCKRLFAEELEQRVKLLGTWKATSDSLVATLMQSSEQIAAKRRWSSGLAPEIGVLYQYFN